MKLKHFLVSLAGLMLVAVPFLSLSPVAVSAAQPTIAVDPTTGTIGDYFAISGSGNANTTYNIYFSSQNKDINKVVGVDVTAYKFLVEVTAGGVADHFSVSDPGVRVPARLDGGTTIEDVHGGTYYLYLTSSGVTKTIYAKTTFTVVGVAEASIYPTSGPVGTEVEVEGSGFAPGEAIAVYLDGDDLTDEIEGDDNADTDGEIYFSLIIPEATYGAQHLTITGAESDAEVVLTFTVSPRITINPTSGTAGTEVSVSGTGFAKRNAVNIYLDSGTTPIGSGTTTTDGSFGPVTITIPPGTTTGAHTIHARDATNSTISASASFNVIRNPALALVEPPQGGYYVGDTLEIDGEAFAPGAVSFFIDGEVITPEEAVTVGAQGTFSASFTLPPLTRGTHSLTARDSTGSEATVNFSIKPKITLSANQGRPGTQITVTGTGFDGGSAVLVRFDGTPVPTTPPAVTVAADGSFSAAFAVPAGVIPSEHIVDAIVGSAQASATFTTSAFMQARPTSGQVGTEITLTGGGLGANSPLDIYFDDSLVPGDFAANSQGELDSITFTVPAAPAGEHEIRVESSGVSLGATFSVTPQITIAPTSGMGGVPVAISGSGFSATSQVTISLGANQTTTPTDAKGSFTTSITIPPAIPGTYTVTASAGTLSASATYTITVQVLTNPTTSPSSPADVGQEITISGRGFTPGADVAITADGEIEVANATVKQDGTFLKVISVPPLSGGEHTLTINDGTAISIDIPLYVEATPPASPQPLSPPMDDRPDQPVVFSWGAVTDPSGTSYDLQVARDDAFASLVVDVRGLTETNYTIPEETPLETPEDNGFYYWRVRAVDGAGNTSPWSAPGTFTVGGFYWPEWTQWVWIGLAIVAAFFLGLWLGRRSMYRWS